MIKDIFKRLIRIYTPFILAFMSIIYGVMFYNGYRGVAYNIINEIIGHSIFTIIYILCTCKQMCVWYKATNWILFSIHPINILCHLGYINKLYMINIIFVFSLVALITFLLYRIKVGITKFLC